MSVRVRIAKPRWHRAIIGWRFLVGRDVSGAYKTDHTWRRRGTQVTATNGRASRWSYMPMRRRAGLRVGAALLLPALPVWLALDYVGTVGTLRVLAWLTLLVAAWMVYEKSRKYMHHKVLRLPMADALAQYFKDSRYVHDPRAWLVIPNDPLDGGTTVYLPSAYSPTETQEKALVRLVSRKLGLVAPSVTLELKGDRPFIELRPAPAPRDVVRFSDPEMRALVDAAPEGCAFLGLGPRDTPCNLDFNTQSPHVGMSMATNAGKSTTARCVIMKVLHDGGVALVLDPKMDSHLWARGLPNVRYADTAEDIHTALLWLSAEMDRRSTVAREHADVRGNVDPALIGPRLLVVGEEINTLEIDLSAYWRTIRERGDPIKPLSLTALGRSLNMGRARRINALLIAQELLVQSLGGPAAKTNLSTRILGRANTPTWNKLAPECKVNGRYPRKSMHRGRVYVVTGEEPLAVQVMLTDEQDAIDYSLSGIVVPFPHEAAHEAAHEAGTPNPQDEATSQHADHSETDPHAEPASLPHQAGDIDEVLTLSDAAEVLQISLKTLRNARERDLAFPEPASTERGKPSTYYLTELQKWAITRACGVGGGAL